MLTTNIKSSKTIAIHLFPDIKSLNFHPSSDFLFILTSQTLTIFNTNQEKIQQELNSGGFKLILDIFSPQKVIILDKNMIKVSRNFNKNLKIYNGEIQDLIDASINPSQINSIFVLTSTQLLLYDTVMFYLAFI